MEASLSPPSPAHALSLESPSLSMERKLTNQKGSSVTISSSKWPGDYMMSIHYADGKMHIMFIKDVEAEVRMLLSDGYVEVKE
jgi:hypothetical protein